MKLRHLIYDLKYVENQFCYGAKTNMIFLYTSYKLHADITKAGLAANEPKNRIVCKNSINVY